MTVDLTTRVKQEALRLGFDRVGVAPVRESDHGAFYRAWLEAGRHGEMGYLARPDAVEKRLDPRRLSRELTSAIVVAHNYYPGGNGEVEDDPSRGIVARYARGRDYHKVVKKRLMRLLRRLEREAGRELPAARAYVDTGPVLERELARRAGLGWFGRNTMLIDPRAGSYLFLGVLLTELELESDDPFESDHCGSCNACVDACPTGALLGRDENGAPVMDATRCISYQTIENRGPIPRELRPLIGNRVYGCDICQEVCPWNSKKLVRITAEPDYAARGPGEVPSGVTPEGREDVSADSPNGSSHPGTDAPSLIELMAMDQDDWESFSRGSAVRRAGRAGFLRNVAVALGNWSEAEATRNAGCSESWSEAEATRNAERSENWNVAEAVPVLVGALSDPEPLVRGHAAWALGRVGTATARSAVSKRLEAERDDWVREELALALEP